jgi:hypothetical protein
MKTPELDAVSESTCSDEECDETVQDNFSDLLSFCNQEEVIESDSESVLLIQEEHDSESTFMSTSAIDINTCDSAEAMSKVQLMLKMLEMRAEDAVMPDTDFDFADNGDRPEAAEAEADIMADDDDDDVPQQLTLHRLKTADDFDADAGFFCGVLSSFQYSCNACKSIYPWRR